MRECEARDFFCGGRCLQELVRSFGHGGSFYHREDLVPQVKVPMVPCYQHDGDYIYAYAEEGSSVRTGFASGAGRRGIRRNEC